MSTAVALPTNIQLPAHLQTADAAAQIAAANAAAGGGIRTGGFPKISIEGSKFHEIDPAIDGGAARTYMVAGAPGQPPLPMMCLEAVVVGANPNLVKTYYAAKWVKGEANAPDCQSTNGVTPDSHITAPQSPVCATCPQNQWGSKISEATGKEVKACSDTKQLVLLPAADLAYKALGLGVTPAALGDFGKFVKDLSGRGIPLPSIVVNITFDHTASFPKLKFAFNRFLTEAEYHVVKERAQGDDVKAIITPAARVPVPALPSPAAATSPVQAALQPTALPQANLQAPAAPVAPQPPAPQPAPAPAPAGFGATTAAPAAPAASTPPATPAPAPRKRAPRTQTPPPAPAAQIDLSYLPPAIFAAVQAVGVDSEQGKQILAAFPAPAAPGTAATVTAGTATTDVQAMMPAAQTTASAGFGATAAAPAAPAAPAPAPAAAASSAASLAAALKAKLATKPAQ